jgi:hypothetical protein
MLGIILFDFYKGIFMRGIANIISMVVGTALLWILCAAKMEFVAYGLLLLPVLFTIFLLAILVFDQSLLSITHDYKGDGSGSSQTNTSNGRGTGQSSNRSGHHSCPQIPSCVSDSCNQSC